jgi:single-strand DNA-binding protein
MGKATLTVEGNVGKDPQLTFSKDGKAITKFNVAVNYQRKNRDTGQWEEDGDTLWVQVVTFGFLAEDCAESVTAGAGVFVDGRPKLETWQGREGDTRTTLTLLADRVGVKPKRSQPQSQQQGRRQLRTVPKQNEWEHGEEAPF